MTNFFAEAYRMTSSFEKGYVNNPKDRGGPTNFGITEATARADGYLGDMRDLPEVRALSIAKRKYWDPLLLDDVASVSPAVAREVFDTGFLCGQHNAALFLQRQLNLLNREQRDFNDVVGDGHIGPATIAALQAYFAARAGQPAEKVLLLGLNVEQGAYLAQTATAIPADEDFYFGWLLKRVAL